jgi:hypothetical protein
MLKKATQMSFLILCFLRPLAGAEVLDKVVAFVDTEAITLTELNETHEIMNQLSPGITHREVLNTMINRLLLIREARKLRLELADEDQLLNDYIEMKVRSFINIKESVVLDFYKSNISDFENKPYAEVKEEIEAYLREKEVNFRIRQHLDSLKENTHIRILLEDT